MGKFPDSAESLFRAVVNTLSGMYPMEEITAISYRTVQEYAGFTLTDVMAGKPFIATPHQKEQWEEILQRLKKAEPLQYIFNRAWFYDRPFYVDPSVLIPRQETEELILLATTLLKPGMKVLDIGTGSGCIPVTLAKEIKGLKIRGCDIAPDSLAVAEKNAEILKADVSFFYLDILKENIPGGLYDMLISNPPYVMEREKSLMNKNVLDYEPDRALFVPDDDPLLFYKTIAKKGKNCLIKGGYLLFEINENLGSEMIDLMVIEGYTGVELIHDLNGKNRIIKAICN